MSNDVLAVVNGREITSESLDAAITRFPQDRRNDFASGEGRKQLLEQIIAWELLSDYALEKKFDESEAYRIQLEDARRSILTQLAIQDTLKDITVEDKEVEDYYNANKAYFVDDEQVRARHILVDTIEKANEVTELINNGMTFEEAANLFSTCPSKTNGGDLGFFSKGMMVPEFEEAAFKLEKGVLSSPVKTQFGYHLIFVEDKKEAELKSFDEMKAFIKTQLVQNKQSRVYTELVNNLEKKYSVERK